MARTNKQKDYYFKTEQIRTQISERDDVTTIYFHLKNLDVKTLSHVYPTELGEPISQAFDQIPVPDNATVNYEAFYQSHVVATHKLISKFNHLAAELKAKPSEARESNSVLNKQYRNKALSVGDKISKSFRDKFIKCLNVNDITFKTLEPHIDTLFFVCLYFYNEYWDTYGIDFNGAIDNNPMKELTPAAQPFEYRAISQVKFLSSVLYEYFDPTFNTDSLSISTGKMHQETKDPILIGWFMDSIIEKSLPASTSRYGVLLCKLLKSTYDYTSKSFLKELKKFTLLKLPDLNNVKRKIVREYCLEIHKIFSFYLRLPTDSFNGKRTHIYHGILLCFSMDDFRETKREFETPNDSKERNAAINRLSVLLRDKRKPIPTSLNASKTFSLLDGCLH